jgi:TRAP-type mannitol/chloroaromatic compound transport system permease small subunit
LGRAESRAVMMSLLLQVSRAIDALNERVGRLAEWCVLLAVVISAGNALMRYGFSFSSNAWLEIQWYLFGAMFMLGAPHALKRNEHVRVDVVYGNLPPRLRLWVDLLGGVLFLMPAVLIIGWMSWPLFYESWRSGEVSGNAGGLIRWPIKLLMPLGFGLMALQGLSEIIKRIAALSGRRGIVADYEKPLS